MKILNLIHCYSAFLAVSFQGTPCAAQVEDDAPAAADSSAWKDPFETSLVVTHLVDAQVLLQGAPTTEDVQHMQNTILESFNQHAKSLCDPTRLVQVAADWKALEAAKINAIAVLVTGIPVLHR